MIIQLGTPRDLSEHRKFLMEVERLAWNSDGANIAAGDLKVRRRLEVFAAGVTIATVDDGVGLTAAGSQYAFQLNWDGNPGSLTSWDEMTHEGWYDQVHVQGGNTGFLVGVGVVPDCRGAQYGRVHMADSAEFGYQHLVAFQSSVDVPNALHLRPHPKWTGSYKLSELLIARTLDTLLANGAKQVIGNARVPGYHLRPELSIEEYCMLRRQDGKLFDPVLRFHERMGARILKPVAYSLEDAESLNAGCWVVYDHAFAG
ncbi:MAG: hypothetical protein COW24_05175 [Candidatus Kerfeldbacteria bacterium CG15_BIG_FIL_POST_REV_8_21_14_020_45_12]|uniref:GNAT family N-acetyltransferase n=1 Tax=Candidatus Kerfeldbacteria bacterium CG15_BIG_FIL_POST_REV_8_21_14_020_45_12 TaxID=2014247 RepID=A0A2M7H2R1_9BACT|nr:MAG: hypothetical protein COW24_05175 [Candidatus Kerfeldbacteria bacterium CG15_BIG_FIL_POST_REV_8_21_14_020_45_12]PJA92835.1 MAG: hypothetical protein CO132_05550 [Candidatus Kerfeldbacteria bacterium CG_4_9_14_3_um_filter_45_8]